MRIVNEPFHDTSFNNPSPPFKNRGLCLLKGMNPITMASSKISVQMGFGTKFRLGYISEDYKCSANAPTAGYHFASSFFTAQSSWVT